jgi:hypothetical protein
MVFEVGVTYDIFGNVIEPYQDTVDVYLNVAGGAMNGVQADAPYVSAGTLPDPNNPTTPLGDLPGGLGQQDGTNISDVTPPSSGWAFSAAGAPRNTGGVGEFLTNAWKNLSSGFLSTMNTKAGANNNRGGAYSSAGPGMSGAQSTVAAANAGMSGQSGVVWLLMLGGALLVILLFSHGRMRV